MDLKAVRESFETAGYAERMTLAAAYAADARPEDLVAIAALLVHEVPAVRLGAIEVLGAARFAPAVGPLRAMVDKGKGDERVFALRALTRIATPTHKAELLPHLQRWLKDEDPFVIEHARALFLTLKGESDSGGLPDVPVPVPVELYHPEREVRRAALVDVLKNHPDPAAALARALTETRSDVVRMDLAGGLGTIAPKDLARVAPFALGRLDPDGIALLARTLARKLAGTDRDALAPIGQALERARARHPEHPLVTEAIDACLVTLDPPGTLGPLLARFGALSPEARALLGRRLKSTAKDEARTLLAPLIDGLFTMPLAVVHVAEAIAGISDRLAAEERARLRKLALVALARAPGHGEEARVLRVEVARLLTAVSRPGEPMPAALVDALLHERDDESHGALIALAKATSTEEGALALIGLLERASPAIATRARAALETFSSVSVDVRARGAGFEVVPRYRSRSGERLEAMPGALRSVTGEAFVIDAHGDVVLESSTTFGGCRCCARPHALVAYGAERPSCPVTGAPHLIDGGRPVLERQHRLGGCGACASPRPLVEDQGRVVCPACGTVHVEEGGRYRPRPPDEEEPPAAEATFGAAPDLAVGLAALLPVPPTSADLDRALPIVRRAMCAHVFFLDPATRACIGSGVVLDVDRGQAAVLTHRHLFTGGREARAYTMAGGLLEVRPHWTASHDLDLAVVIIEGPRLERLANVRLDEEHQPFVGSTVFAVGSQKGVSWSYVSGTLSAFREVETGQGLLIRLVETQLPLSSGAQGAALYHERGSFLGMLSFTRRIPISGARAVYALTRSVIREALFREEVTFGGRLLADGTPWHDPLAVDE